MERLGAGSRNVLEDSECAEYKIGEHRLCISIMGNYRYGGIRCLGLAEPYWPAGCDMWGPLPRLPCTAFCLASCFPLSCPTFCTPPRYLFYFARRDLRLQWLSASTCFSRERHATRVQCTGMRDLEVHDQELSENLKYFVKRTRDLAIIPYFVRSKWNYSIVSGSVSRRGSCIPRNKYLWLKIFPKNSTDIMVQRCTNRW